LSAYLRKPIVQICEPKNINHVLADKFDDSKLDSVHVNDIMPLIGHGIFVSDGREWKWFGTLQRPGLERKKIIRFLEVDRALECHVKDFLACIPSPPPRSPY
jgi:hypothetical protein